MSTNMYFHNYFYMRLYQKFKNQCIVLVVLHKIKSILIFFSLFVTKLCYEWCGKLNGVSSYTQTEVRLLFLHLSKQKAYQQCLTIFKKLCVRLNGRKRALTSRGNEEPRPLGLHWNCKTHTDTSRAGMGRSQTETQTLLPKVCI